MDRRHFLSMPALEMAARAPRIERASEYAGELIRITADTRQMFAEHNGRREPLEVICGAQCAGIFATSYNDPSPIIFHIDGAQYTVRQQPRPVVSGVLVKPYAEYPPRLLERIRRETRRKQEAFRQASAPAWQHGFQLPLRGTGDPFGKLRRVRYKDERGRLVMQNGRIKEDLKAHEGMDIPAPRGTPVVAPLDGVVLLADSRYYFDANLVILGHGKLITTYLHLDDIAVRPGAAIARGKKLGTVGAGGYGVTGPHLHWAAKYGGRTINPYSLGILAR